MTSRVKRTRERLQTPRTGDGRVLFHPILMMHAARLAGQTYEQFMRDASNLVAANLKCVEMYDMDAVSAISDPYRETSAFGAEVTFDGDYPPKAARIVVSAEDIDRLQNPDVTACERTRDRIDACSMLREALGPQFPVIGWVEGPLAEAADLMGVSEAMISMVMEPEPFKRLLDKTLQTAKDFAREQIKAGADIIGVGDALCSQISPEMFGEFCFERQKELFDYIHSLGAMVKVHICGDITHILPYLAKEDIDILDIDWMVDMAHAYKIMGPDVVLCGNLDPVAVVMEGSKADILAKYEQVRASLPPENWIMMAGCEIPLQTPPENMHYLRQISLK